MNPADWKTLEATCTSLRTASPGFLKWSWDGRLGAVLATFQAPDAPAIQSLLARHLPERWDRSTLKTAPQVVQDTANAIGGVRADQAILASDPSRQGVAIGAWWPWGGGQTISIRIFPAGNGLAPDEQQAFAAAFQSWFGL